MKQIAGSYKKKIKENWEKKILITKVRRVFLWLWSFLDFVKTLKLLCFLVLLGKNTEKLIKYWTINQFLNKKQNIECELKNKIFVHGIIGMYIYS